MRKQLFWISDGNWGADGTLLQRGRRGASVRQAGHQRHHAYAAFGLARLPAGYGPYTTV